MLTLAAYVRADKHTETFGLVFLVLYEQKKKKLTGQKNPKLYRLKPMLANS